MGLGRLVIVSAILGMYPSGSEATFYLKGLFPEKSLVKMGSERQCKTYRSCNDGIYIIEIHCMISNHVVVHTQTCMRHFRSGGHPVIAMRTIQDKELGMDIPISVRSR